MTEANTKFRALSESTEEDRLMPIDLQQNPSLAQAVEPDRVNPEVETIAARNDVPEFRTPENEPETVAPKERKTTAESTGKTPAKTPATAKTSS